MNKQSNEYFVNNVICHVVGINNFIKDDFINTIKKYDNIVVKDLDLLTNDIRNSPEMAKLNKSLNAQKGDKTIITKQIQDLWKSMFIEKVNNVIKRNGKHKIIFIGLSTFHKNHKLKININTKNKFFININPQTNAQNVIQYNIEKYKKFIINGSFPLKYIDYKFMVEQREYLINVYTSYEYKLKSINNIYKWLDIYMSNIKQQNINTILGQQPIDNKLYIGSTTNYDNFIKINKNISHRKHNNDAILSKLLGTTSNINTEIFCYTEKWLALIHSNKNINNYIKKGLIQIGNKSVPALKEKFKNAFDVLNTNCYIYVVNNNGFNKINDYKYKSLQTINIKQKEYIKNVYDELAKLGVKFMKKK